MMDIKDITKRVAMDLDGETAWEDQAPLTKDLQLFAERLLAAWLKEGGEPVAWIVVGKTTGKRITWYANDGPVESAYPSEFYRHTPIFLAPPPAVPEWQPIETAPKDGSEVLLYLGDPWNKVEKARWYAPWRTWQVGAIPFDPAREEYRGIGSAIPTHWIPLPAAPEPRKP